MSKFRVLKLYKSGEPRFCVEEEKRFLWWRWWKFHSEWSTLSTAMMTIDRSIEKERLEAIPPEIVYEKQS